MAIGDAGLVTLAPALRRRPALVRLNLMDNPLGDEGIAALVAPPPPTGALPTTSGGLKKLTRLNLNRTQVSDAGCAALASALDSDALPALEVLKLYDIPASVAAKQAVRAALARSTGRRMARRHVWPAGPSYGPLVARPTATQRLLRRGRLNNPNPNQARGSSDDF